MIVQGPIQSEENIEAPFETWVLDGDVEHVDPPFEFARLYASGSWWFEHRGLYAQNQVPYDGSPEGMAKAHERIAALFAMVGQEVTP